MEQSPLLTLRFGEYLKILEQRGYKNKVTLYAAFIAVECIARNRDPETITVKEALEMLRFPPKPAGWDNFAWGSAVTE